MDDENIQGKDAKKDLNKDPQKQPDKKADAPQAGDDFVDNEAINEAHRKLLKAKEEAKRKQAEETKLLQESLEKAEKDAKEAAKKDPENKEKDQSWLKTGVETIKAPSKQDNGASAPDSNNMLYGTALAGAGALLARPVPKAVGAMFGFAGGYIFTKGNLIERLASAGKGASIGYTYTDPLAIANNALAKPVNQLAAFARIWRPLPTYDLAGWRGLSPLPAWHRNRSIILPDTPMEKEISKFKKVLESYAEAEKYKSDPKERCSPAEFDYLEKLFDKGPDGDKMRKNYKKGDRHNAADKAARAATLDSLEKIFDAEKALRAQAAAPVEPPAPAAAAAPVAAVPEVVVPLTAEINTAPLNTDPLKTVFEKKTGSLKLGTNTEGHRFFVASEANIGRLERALIEAGVSPNHMQVNGRVLVLDPQAVKPVEVALENIPKDIPKPPPKPKPPAVGPAAHGQDGGLYDKRTGQRIGEPLRNANGETLPEVRRRLELAAAEAAGKPAAQVEPAAAQPAPVPTETAATPKPAVDGEARPSAKPVEPNAAVPETNGKTVETKTQSAAAKPLEKVTTTERSNAKPASLPTETAAIPKPTAVTPETGSNTTPTSNAPLTEPNSAAKPVELETRTPTPTKRTTVIERTGMALRPANWVAMAYGGVGTGKDLMNGKFDWHTAESLAMLTSGGSAEALNIAGKANASKIAGSVAAPLMLKQGTIDIVHGLGGSFSEADRKQTEERFAKEDARGGHFFNMTDARGHSVMKGAAQTYLGVEGGIVGVQAIRSAFIRQAGKAVATQLVARGATEAGFLAVGQAIPGVNAVVTVYLLTDMTAELMIARAEAAEAEGRAMMNAGVGVYHQLKAQAPLYDPNTLLDQKQFLDSFNIEKRRDEYNTSLANALNDSTISSTNMDALIGIVARRKDLESARDNLKSRMEKLNGPEKEKAAEQLQELNTIVADINKMLPELGQHVLKEAETEINQKSTSKEQAAKIRSRNEALVQALTKGDGPISDPALNKLIEVKGEIKKSEAAIARSQDIAFGSKERSVTLLRQYPVIYQGVQAAGLLGDKKYNYPKREWQTNKAADDVFEFVKYRDKMSSSYNETSHASVDVSKLKGALAARQKELYKEIEILSDSSFRNGGLKGAPDGGLEDFRLAWKLKRDAKEGIATGNSHNTPNWASFLINGYQDDSYTTMLAKLELYIQEVNKDGLGDNTDRGKAKWRATQIKQDVEEYYKIEWALKALALQGEGKVIELDAQGREIPNGKEITIPSFQELLKLDANAEKFATKEEWRLIMEQGKREKEFEGSIGAIDSKASMQKLANLANQALAPQLVFLQAQKIRDEAGFPKDFKGDITVSEKAVRIAQQHGFAPIQMSSVASVINDKDFEPVVKKYEEDIAKLNEETKGMQRLASDNVISVLQILGENKHQELERNLADINKQELPDSTKASMKAAIQRQLNRHKEDRSWYVYDSELRSQANDLVSDPRALGELQKMVADLDASAAKLKNEGKESDPAYAVIIEQVSNFKKITDNKELVQKLEEFNKLQISRSERLMEIQAPLFREIQERGIKKYGQYVEEEQKNIEKSVKAFEDANNTLFDNLIKRNATSLSEETQRDGRPLLNDYMAARDQLERMEADFIARSNQIGASTTLSDNDKQELFESQQQAVLNLREQKYKMLKTQRAYYEFVEKSLDERTPDIIKAKQNIERAKQSPSPQDTEAAKKVRDKFNKASEPLWQEAEKKYNDALNLATGNMIELQKIKDAGVEHFINKEEQAKLYAELGEGLKPIREDAQQKYDLAVAAAHAEYEKALDSEPKATKGTQEYNIRRRAEFDSQNFDAWAVMASDIAQGGSDANKKAMGDLIVMRKRLVDTRLEASLLGNTTAERVDVYDQFKTGNEVYVAVKKAAGINKEYKSLYDKYKALGQAASPEKEELAKKMQALSTDYLKLAQEGQSKFAIDRKAFDYYAANDIREYERRPQELMFHMREYAAETQTKLTAEQRVNLDRLNADMDLLAQKDGLASPANQNEISFVAVDKLVRGSQDQLSLERKAHALIYNSVVPLNEVVRLTEKPVTQLPVNSWSPGNEMLLREMHRQLTLAKRDKDVTALETLTQNAGLGIDYKANYNPQISDLKVGMGGQIIVPTNYNTFNLAEDGSTPIYKVDAPESSYAPATPDEAALVVFNNINDYGLDKTLDSLHLFGDGRFIDEDNFLTEQGREFLTGVGRITTIGSTAYIEPGQLSEDAEALLKHWNEKKALPAYLERSHNAVLEVLLDSAPQNTEARESLKLAMEAAPEWKGQISESVVNAVNVGDFGTAIARLKSEAKSVENMKPEPLDTNEVFQAKKAELAQNFAIDVTYTTSRIETVQKALAKKNIKTPELPVTMRNTLRSLQQKSFDALADLEASPEMATADNARIMLQVLANAPAGSIKLTSDKQKEFLKSLSKTLVADPDPFVSSAGPDEAKKFAEAIEKATGYKLPAESAPTIEKMADVPAEKTTTPPMSGVVDVTTPVVAKLDTPSASIDPSTDSKNEALRNALATGVAADKTVVKTNTDVALPAEKMEAIQKALVAKAEPAPDSTTQPMTLPDALGGLLSTPQAPASKLVAVKDKNKDQNIK